MELCTNWNALEWHNEWIIRWVKEDNFKYLCDLGEWDKLEGYSSHATFIQT